MRKKYLPVIVILVFLLLFNKMLGEFLGRVGRCSSFYDKENRVKIYTSCNGITNALIGDVLSARAFTLDHVILTNYESLTANTYKHELAHTKQYSYFGPLFLPFYNRFQEHPGFSIQG